MKRSSRGDWRSQALAALAVGAMLLVGGCGGRLIDESLPPHGNLHAELATPHASRLVSPPRPMIVMIERHGARAIDPVDGKQLWLYPREVVGHPVGSADAVYLPLRGNRVAAVDRRSGALRWIAQLPGEALTGLAVTQSVLVAVVLEHSDSRPEHGSAKSTRQRRKKTGRSRLVALGTEDAAVTWQRRSRARIGAPVAQGQVFLVPIGEAVVALNTQSGRETARVTLDSQGHSDGELSHIVKERDGTLIVGGGNRFVNLRSSSGGKAPTPQRIDTGYGVLFPAVAGMDHGFDDTARLQLALSFADTGEAPRQGVLLSRRAIISMRLAPSGRPLRPRWVHFDRYDRHEFVAVATGDQRVTLVREDGAIVELDAETGDPIHTWTGLAKTSGALMLEIHDTAPPDRGRPPSESKTTATLRRLIREEDGRLLPAQILAVELLWRSDQVRSRRLVDAVAERTLGPWQTEPGQQLSAHASKTRARSWGTLDPPELARRLDRLSQRPSFLADRSLSVADLAEEVVHSGTPAMVGHIVDHLMHPATPADDLPRLVAALGQLGGLTATQGLINFMQAYHADPDIVSESTAVHAAVDTLAALLANHDPAAQRVQSVLDEAYHDPFTDPALRVHIEQTLRGLGLSAPSAAPSHAAP